MKKIAESELIINKNGSIFHLHLFPDQIADTVLLVGDPGRVEMVAKYFSSIESESANREFVSKTGVFNNKRISVLSTGIGTDNIDIVLNELDALVNIDFKSRTVKPNHKRLNLIRLGTSGGLQRELGVDVVVASKMSIGFDGLLNFYAGRNEISNLEAEKKFVEHTDWNDLLTKPYFVTSSQELLDKLAVGYNIGNTISAPGFYAPQGRELRLKTANPSLKDKISSFVWNNSKILNFEMESSAIYGLSKLLGHNALTMCAVIANRIAGIYSKDYKKIVDSMIKQTLERISEE